MYIKQQQQQQRNIEQLTNHAKDCKSFRIEYHNWVNAFMTEKTKFSNLNIPLKLYFLLHDKKFLLTATRD